MLLAHVLAMRHIRDLLLSDQHLAQTILLYVLLPWYIPVHHGLCLLCSQRCGHLRRLELGLV